MNPSVSIHLMLFVWYKTSFSLTLREEHLFLSVRIVRFMMCLPIHELTFAITCKIGFPRLVLLITYILKTD